MKYVVIVLKKNGKFDSILHELFPNYSAAIKAINDAKLEDKKNKWEYTYRTQIIEVKK